MGKTPNWLQMPDEIMGGMIFQRLGAVEILTSVQKVCRNWRRICKDPAMWKVIDMNNRYKGLNTDVYEKLTKQAVHRIRGELIEITLHSFGTDDLLNFISRWYLCSTFFYLPLFSFIIIHAHRQLCENLGEIEVYKILKFVVLFVVLNGNLVRSSSKLKSLCLVKCYSITGNGLVHALRRLPCLETLDLSYISIDAENIKVIGQSCPLLKSFKMKTLFMECDGDAFAIANSMPALRHLQLFDSTITDDGLKALLHGCPHLESLDLSDCSYLELDGDLEKLCRERIKDFNFTPLSEAGCMCGPGGCTAYQDYKLSVSPSLWDFDYHSLSD
ncbi:hypothetical protein OSB04_001880 [Centaurea solstitialis]|uniref:F-box domain-containing protein n=1 Tax=Centaurea solstitialis TaxID=347529 RepID=A0AA38TTM2_9ASTR|nr:hypothetical protein OSB04_001880 [Centaurea solstitialis]